ncbi:MAG: polysaccharide deacetylase family protein [Thermomicrobiales bacterium]
MTGFGVPRCLRVVASAVGLLLCGMMLPALLGRAGVAAQDQSNRVPILAYHNVDYSGSAYSVTPEQLDAQCRWLLDNGYTPVSIDAFWDAAMGNSTLPPNPVMLTDDDGWSSAPVFAQIVAQYGFPATFFINNVSPLTTDQIANLAGFGAVEAHTVTHAHLNGLDYDGQFTEINTNKTFLEQTTGQPVRFLAWPFGERNDSAIQAAKDSGMVAAFGLGGNAAWIGALDPYQIPRILIEVGDDLTSFAAKVNGA